MNKKLTFWGASPIVFFLAILYTIPVIILNHLFKPFFEIGFIPYKILLIIAIVLLCLGIPLYIVTVKILKAAYKNKTPAIFPRIRKNKKNKPGEIQEEK